MTVRVASLLRLSSKKQAKKQGNGEPDIPGQRQEIAKYMAQRPGWVLVQEFVEAGVSAFKKGREERDVLQAVMKGAADGDFDVLLLWKGDRLSRRLDQLPSIVKDLLDTGVELWSVVDAPGGKKWTADNALELLMISIEGFKNQSESEAIALRTRTRKRQLAEEGRWLGGPIPYGYTLATRRDERGEPVYFGDRPVRDLVPDPDTAPVVISIFQWYLAGKGGQLIAADLNAQRVLPPRGTEWQSQGVRYILANPFYAGLLVYGRSSLGKRMVPDQITAEGPHPPIISREQWEGAQQLRRARVELLPRQRDATYALAGILRCGQCGRLMGAAKHNYRVKSGERRSSYGYRCMGYTRNRSCVVTRHMSEEVETAFITALEECFTAPTGLRTFLEQQAQAAGESIKADQAARRRMQERLKEIETALKRLDRAYFEAGTVDDAEYAEKKRAYQVERDQLQVELAKPITTEEARDVSALVDLVKQLRILWYDEETTAAERKAIALSLVKSWRLKVLVHPDKRVEIVPE